MFAQRHKPVDFAAEGSRLALSVDRNCGIRGEPARDGAFQRASYEGVGRSKFNPGASPVLSFEVSFNRGTRSFTSFRTDFEPRTRYHADCAAERVCGAVCFTFKLKNRGLVCEPETNQIIQRCDPIFPSDLFALGIGAAVIGDRDFIEAALFFGKFDGDLRFEAESR